MNIYDPSLHLIEIPFAFCKILVVVALLAAQVQMVPAI
jgi:hypothetical protein